MQTGGVINIVNIFHKWQFSLFAMRIMYKCVACGNTLYGQYTCTPNCYDVKCQSAIISV